MKVVSLLAAGLAALQLVACASTSLRDLKPIPQSRIYDVIAETKRQIGVYTSFQWSPYGYDRMRAASRTKHCGNGMIGFDIQTATLELVSTSEGSASVAIGLDAVPIGTGPTVGGKASASRTTTDTQSFTLDYDVKMAPEGVPFKLADLDTAPLAVAMINLWGASLASGDEKTDVCLKVKSASKAGNTFTMGLTWKEKQGGEISLGLAPLVFTPSGERTSTTGNTLTVSFEPHDFTKPWPVRPRKCPAGSLRSDCPNQGILAFPPAKR